MHRVLVLGGTAEGREISGEAALRGIEVTVSLAGVTRDPRPMGVPVRTGGFGGAKGLANWLRAERIGAVIDATHPFAAKMPFNAAAACGAAGVPRLRLLRPEWPVRPEWMLVPDLSAAAEALPAGARVFLTTGREIAPFAQRTDCRFWVRTIEPVPLPAHMEPIAHRPPSPKGDELKLMRRLAPTHLVSKNSGGNPAKLDIAGALGVVVVMVTRPPPPTGPVAGTPGEALRWLFALLDRGDRFHER